MEATNKIAALVAAALLVSVGAVYAVPAVSNVTMQQRGNLRIVDIGYTLSDEEAIITVGIETNGVPLPDSAVTRLTGDVSVVVQPDTASKSIVWYAGLDWPEHEVTNAKARVTAWSTTSPPQVMVIDLGKGTSATEQDQYPVFYYNSLDALPGGGLSNDVYKTVMLVMNKISAGVYEMGDEATLGASVTVTLMQDFYAGVYEVTQKQWAKVLGSDPSEFKNSAGPVGKVSYEDIRGSVNDSPTVNWPVTDRTVVTANSFMGKLRSNTGLSEFDLPTEAQWEYACRAGTTTYYNDGISGSNPAQLDVLGWWGGNSELSSHTVGQKTPNAWGLYDMHGNVWEWCLDWYPENLESGTDPVGAESGTTRSFRGASWADAAAACRTECRVSVPPSGQHINVGFRLVRTLP